MAPSLTNTGKQAFTEESIRLTGSIWVSGPSQVTPSKLANRNFDAAARAAGAAQITNGLTILNPYENLRRVRTRPSNLTDTRSMRV